MRLLRFLVKLVVVLVLAGFVSLTLVILAPGAGADERELDPSLSESTRERLAPPESGDGLASRYWAQLRGLARGDLGTSVSFGAPVASLVRDRAGVTARTGGIGLLAAWLIATVAAVAALLWRPASHASAFLTTVFLCVPSGLLALAAYSLSLPAAAVIAAAVAPKLFTYLTAILSDANRRPHVAGAIARGVPGWRVFAVHRVLPLSPELLALGGVSVTMALGASIPAEVLCGVPGLGQLAWKSALGRDAAPLIALTWIIGGVTLIANTLGGALSGSGKAWRE